MVYKGARPVAKWKPGPTTYGGNEMKKLVVFGLTTLIMVVASVGVAQAQSKEKKNVIYVAAEKATFSQSPTAGVSMAVLWGDPNKGPHGTFTKFAPGYDAGLHTHTSDVWLVVIQGAYLYKDDEGEKRVGPGEFLRVPGGHRHWSGGDKADGALFYQEGSGKFDLIPAK
jgi:quercetin dioxygenase-like cupin family protein